MKVTLRFFASLRETLAVSQESLDLPDGVNTIGALRHHLAARGAPWSEALAPQRPVRAALNQRMCDDDALLAEGCEVAYFPPVTGG